MFFDRNLLKRCLRLVLDFFLASALDDKNAFAFRIFLFVASDGIFNRGLPCRLVFLGQFPAECQPPVAKRLQQLPQRFQQMMRRLVYDHRPRLVFQPFQRQFMFFFIRRKKCFEDKSSRRKSRQCQCRHTRACARQACHFDACLVRHLHQLLTRIRNSRCSGIRDQRDICSRQQLLHQLAALVVFVVFVITRHRRMNLKMVQQLNAVSRILRRDQIDLLQNADCTEGHVLQISNWCCTQI